MNVERIITMANRKVQVEFLAMERSLRGTGCRLPLCVIPFDDSRFDLPRDAYWIDIERFKEILQPWSGGSGHFRKFIALFMQNAAFFDADIVHLRNPEEWLARFDQNSFVVADTEFSKALWTFTARTKMLYSRRATNWLANSFNSGFFCYSRLNVEASLFIELLSGWELHFQQKSPSGGEQEAINYIAHALDLNLCNACLPPYAFESTMAVDYGKNYRELLARPNSAPFMHFAGAGRDLSLAVSDLIFEHLTADEATEFRQQFELRRQAEQKRAQWPLWAKLTKRVIPVLDKRFELSWKSSLHR